jgi:Cys-tRNA(Pro)/Cys-tRNA(Cys) deacylase
MTPVPGYRKVRPRAARDRYDGRGTPMEKTNAVRLLEARGIPHRLTVYDADGAFHSAEAAAALVGVPVETVYKTLVVLRARPDQGKPILALIPAHRQLSLKGLARELGARKLRLATQREAEALTGLRVGGISALALPRGRFDVLLDASARAHPRIHVSAGVRGADVELAVADLVALTGARVVRAVSAAGPGAPSGSDPAVPPGQGASGVLPRQGGASSTSAMGSEPGW